MIKIQVMSKMFYQHCVIHVQTEPKLSVAKVYKEQGNLIWQFGEGDKILALTLST